MNDRCPLGYFFYLIFFFFFFFFFYTHEFFKMSLLLDLVLEIPGKSREYMLQAR